MKKNVLILAAVAGLGVAAAFQFSNRSFACGSYSPDIPITERAVSPDTNVSAAAIQILRAKGPAGLQALLDSHADLLRRHMNPADGTTSPEDLAAWNRLRSALDSISGQRDCEASHLYWFTDFDEAKAAAKAANKPILSLRLLGKLDEEYSCANSRFFRTTLYANTEVSQYLRDHFVLHWKSVRPVPRITIDFGDGRKIERTITGNSIHYILDFDGDVIDALPGLYGPKAFLKGLNDAEQAIKTCATLPADTRVFALRQYHTERLAAINAAWDRDMNALGMTVSAMATPTQANPSPNSSGAPPTAMAAGFRATSKMTVEMPMLKSFDKSASATATPAPTPVTFASPPALTAGMVARSKGEIERPMLQSFQNVDDATWTRIAALHREDATLDNSSLTLIKAKYPSAQTAGTMARTKARAEDPLSTMMNNLQRSIAEDTVRNEYQLHAKLHQWFIDGSASNDLARLNARVYAELFLTPDTDPWLGLVPQNTFTALDNNGLVQTSRVP